MKAEKLTPGTEPLWREFVAGHERALAYASLEFRDLLVRVLGATPHYSIALDGQRVRGVLPSFAATQPSLGTVLNSLPYYGSNGGCLTDGDPAVARALLAAFRTLEGELGCAASTLITSPLDPEVALYEEQLAPDLLDGRTGQLTTLPSPGDDPEEKLFALYDETARRNVRKARKSGVALSIEEGDGAFDFLHVTHDENIRAVGGLPKSRAFFTAVAEIIPDSMRRLYIARHEGRRIAALLVLRFGCAAEYYTPVIVESARPLQPLALLVHEAMIEAARDGYRYWNWGGTWRSQTGVYRFKRKWGAIDMPYHYFTRVGDRSILRRSREELLSAFPGFFVAPFDKLAAQSQFQESAR